MNDAQLGVAVKLLRHRRGWRQDDLADRAGCSRAMVSLPELGGAARMSVGTIRRIGDALGMPIGWDAGWRRSELEQLRDARHAGLSNAFKGLLDGAGWDTRVEVSYSYFGERGRVDLLAHHPLTRVVLVVEIKTALVDAQELLGTLDVKRRLAPQIAREIGWRPAAVVPAIVFTESSTIRRRVQAHASLFARFGLHGIHALAWLRRPSAGPYGVPDGVLLFTSLSNADGIGVRHRTRRRVRRGAAPASVNRPPRAPPEPAKDR